MTTASSSLNPAAVTTGPSRERIYLYDMFKCKTSFSHTFKNTKKSRIGHHRRNNVKAQSESTKLFQSNFTYGKMNYFTMIRKVYMTNL